MQPFPAFPIGSDLNQQILQHLLVTCTQNSSSWESRVTPWNTVPPSFSSVNSSDLPPTSQAGLSKILDQLLDQLSLLYYFEHENASMLDSFFLMLFFDHFSYGSSYHEIPISSDLSELQGPPYIFTWMLRGISAEDPISAPSVVLFLCSLSWVDGTPHQFYKSETWDSLSCSLYGN